ncbi:MAG: hypothetical protein RIR70_81 [Pseudomonadota bacterium]|jgi:nucleotide-binding universal stress UspA family protein
MPQKILLAVDGSSCSLAAVRALIEHLGHFTAPPVLHVLYVHRPVPLESATRHAEPDALSRYYREEGQAQLAPAEALLDEAGYAYTPHIHAGDAADTIVRVATELGCDLIAMGTHGHGVAAGAMLGSVCAKVIRRGRVPVFCPRQAA